VIFHRIPKGDLRLDENGNFVFLHGGPEEMLQRIVARLRMFKGEWFLDTRLGIPYFQNVLVRSPNLPAISAMFRRVILTTPGVVEIVSFRLTFDEVSRALILTFYARTSEGDVGVTDAEPLIYAASA
jgi:hypothetical protein